jgi:hypothetical protein
MHHVGSARTLETDGAARNVLRSGPFGVREFANLRIAARLISLIQIFVVNFIRKKSTKLDARVGSKWSITDRHGGTTYGDWRVFRHRAATPPGL